MAKKSSPAWRPDHEDKVFAAEDYEVNVEAYREQQRQFLESKATSLRREPPVRWRTSSAPQSGRSTTRLRKD